MLLIAPHCCFSFPWAWASHKALPETLSPDLNKSERQNYLVLWFLAKHIHKKYRKLLDILLQIAGPFTARKTVALHNPAKMVMWKTKNMEWELAEQPYVLLPLKSVGLGVMKDVNGEQLCIWHPVIPAHKQVTHIHHLSEWKSAFLLTEFLRDVCPGTNGDTGLPSTNTKQNVAVCPIPPYAFGNLSPFHCYLCQLVLNLLGC